MRGARATMPAALSFDVAGAHVRVIPVEAFAVFAGLRQRQRVAVVHFVPRLRGTFLIGQHFGLPGLLALDISLDQSPKV